jgi:hypothetical protein
MPVTELALPTTKPTKQQQKPQKKNNPQTKNNPQNHNNPQTTPTPTKKPHPQNPKTKKKKLSTNYHTFSFRCGHTPNLSKIKKRGRNPQKHNKNQNPPKTKPKKVCP